MKNVMIACVVALSVLGPMTAAQEAVPVGAPAEHTVSLQANDSLLQATPGASPSLASELSLPDGPGETSLAFSDMPADSSQADSLRHAMARRLLPPHLSLLESGLWGESGVLRGIGLAGPLTPESRKSELSARRVMLTAHQIGGFITLGLMGTTVYFGQMTLDNPQNRSYRNTHGNFVTATILSYSLTGALAILSPPPLIRRDEVSTTSIHKLLAWVHVAGMILTPILGASLHHSMNYDQLAHFHQISAYITTATFAAAMIVITF